MIDREEPWFTKEEIAGHYKVSKRTIERLGYPNEPVGGQNRYRISECDEHRDRMNGRGRVDMADNVIELRPKDAA